MAGKRGFRPPSDYDPRRGKKGGGKSAGGNSATSKNAAGKRAAAQRTDGQGATRTGSSTKTGAGSAPRGAENPNVASLKAAKPAPLAAKRTRASDVAGLTFADLGIGGNILRALNDLGATEPFAIQAATIPDVLKGHHLLGRARTGSGKTIAFGAALVERLLILKAEGAFPREPSKQTLKRGERAERKPKTRVRAPKALILAPTRELALQIDRTLQPIARSVGFFTGQFVGGQPFEPQLHALKRGIDIVIGTPGRIEDLAKRGHLPLGEVAVTVIDEADHMSEMGFIEPVQRILRLTRAGGQRLLFSATLDSAVERLVAEFMPNPAIHEIVAEDDDSVAGVPGSAVTHSYRPQENVTHDVHIVLREHKDAVLLKLLADAERAVVFCRTRGYAVQVTELLTQHGVRAIELHGNLSQARRELNLNKFSTGKANVLVATDIAARGMHVDDIELVLQADLAGDAKTYVHRAGRTGRVGKPGRVVTLIARTQQQRARALFDELGFEPDSFADLAP